MWPVFGVQVLILMLFFMEIEASGMSNILTGEKSSQKEKKKLDALATSRLTTSSASTHNPTSREHQAPNLQEYQPRIPNSSQNPISYSGQGNVEWLIQHFGIGASSHSSSSSSIIQNVLIQPHAEEHPGQEASDKKGRSKKGKGKNAIPDLNVPINEKRALRKKVQDLNFEPYYKSSPAIQEAYRILHAPACVGAHGEIKSFEDKQPLTVDKLTRDRESFEHFQSFYNQHPPPSAFSSTPPPVFHSRGFGAHRHAAPSFPPHPEGQFGGDETYRYAAPSFPPQAKGQFGGYGTYGYTATPSHQNPDGHFGGPENNVYAAPSYHPHS